MCARVCVHWCRAGLEQRSLREWPAHASETQSQTPFSCPFPFFCFCCTRVCACMCARVRVCVHARVCVHSVVCRERTVVRAAVTDAAVEETALGRKLMDYDDSIKNVLKKVGPPLRAQWKGKTHTHAHARTNTHTHAHTFSSAVLEQKTGSLRSVALRQTFFDKIKVLSCPFMLSFTPSPCRSLLHRLSTLCLTRHCIAAGAAPRWFSASR